VTIFAQYGRDKSRLSAIAASTFRYLALTSIPLHVISAAVHYIAVRLAPLWAILLGGSASLIVLFGLFYLMRVLEPEDQDRFKILTGALPKPIAGPMDTFLSLLVRPGFAR
jgi:hypothetical protein